MISRDLKRSFNQIRIDFNRILTGGKQKRGNDMCVATGMKYDVAATRGVDSALASDCRAQLKKKKLAMTCQSYCQERPDSFHQRAPSGTPKRSMESG